MSPVASPFRIPNIPRAPVAPMQRSLFGASMFNRRRRPPAQEGPFQPRAPRRFFEGEDPEAQGAFGGQTAADFRRTNELTRGAAIENIYGLRRGRVFPTLPLPQRVIGTEQVPGVEFSETGENILVPRNIFTQEPLVPQQIEAYVTAQGRTVTDAQVELGYQEYVGAQKEALQPALSFQEWLGKNFITRQLVDNPANVKGFGNITTPKEETFFETGRGEFPTDIKPTPFRAGRRQPHKVTLPDGSWYWAETDPETGEEVRVPNPNPPEKPAKQGVDQPEEYRRVPHPTDARFQILQRVQKKADGSWDIQNVRVEETPESRTERERREQITGRFEAQRGGVLASQTGTFGAPPVRTFAPAGFEGDTSRTTFFGPGAGFDPNAPGGSAANPYGSRPTQTSPAFVQNLFNAQQANTQVMAARQRQALYPAALNAIKLLQGNPQALRDDQKAALLRRNPDGSFEGSLAPLFDGGVEEAQGLDLRALWRALQPLGGFGFARQSPAIFAGRR